MQQKSLLEVKYRSVLHMAGRLAISPGGVAAIVSLVACLHLAVWALKNPASTARPRSNAGCRA
jgi:hypothetical protein